MTARIDDRQGRDQRTTLRYTSRRNMSSARPDRGRPRKTDGYTDYATGTDAIRYTSADAEGKRRTLFTAAKFPAAARPDSRPYRRLGCIGTLARVTESVVRVGASWSSRPGLWRIHPGRVPSQALSAGMPERRMITVGAPGGLLPTLPEPS
jgi:hypothetical protein